MSDIRLILVGSIIIVGGFFVGAMGASAYSQFSIQKSQFGDCYDYSSGKAVRANCSQKEQEGLIVIAISIGLLGGGGFVLVKGIRGRWDQNVKPDEMVGPKRG